MYNFKRIIISATSQAYQKWFLINCDRFINYKEHGFMSQSFKLFEIFLRNTVHDCNQLPIQRIKFQKIYVKLYASCVYIYHGATTFQVDGMIPPRTFQKVVLKVEIKNLRPDLLRPHKEV